MVTTPAVLNGVTYIRSKGLGFDSPRVHVHAVSASVLSTVLGTWRKENM